MPEIKVRSPKAGKTVAFEREFTSSDEVKESMFQAMAIIKCQGVARKALEEGKTEEEAIAVGMAYIPGVQVRRVGAKKDPFVAIKEQIESGKITREEAKKKIRDLLG